MTEPKTEELQEVSPDAQMPEGGIRVQQDITLRELAQTFHQSGFFKMDSKANHGA
jgi:hypothetical protein